MKFKKPFFFLFFFNIIFNLFQVDYLLAADFFEKNSNFLVLENFFIKKQKYLIFLIFFIPSLIFLKSKRLILFLLFFIIQNLIIIYWDNFILWLANLAGDSLSEIDTYNIYFIFAWLSSIFDYFEPDLRFSNFIKFYLVGFFTYYILNSFTKNQRILKLYFPIVSSFIFIFFFMNFNINHLIGNVYTQQNIKNNFINSNEKYKIKNDINFIIFIAESNSSLHTNKNVNKIINNKEILKLGNFVNFTNIYATHTHSTPSLLRLFSVPNNDYQNQLKIIEKKKSINIFSFLGNKINKSYISSHDTKGYNNLHYPIFFEKFENKYFKDNTGFIYEKDFFINKFSDILKKNESNNLIIFHSIVGHAPYQKYIPKSKNIINEPNNKDYELKLLGNKEDYFDDVINYKKAISYNFETIRNIILQINNDVPTIFIYLSDHGESVYTGNGHDSSRFVHEMIRIPFLIYYNNEYSKNFLEKVTQNEKLKDFINSSDIFKNIFFDVYSLHNLKKLFFENDNKKYQKLIFQRSKKEITEYIDLNYNRLKLPKNYLIKNDKETDIHILANVLGKENICYHSSNTIARINRGLLLTSCLEFDLVIENNEFYIYHPPSKNIGFSFDEFINVSKEAKTYWIDAKNLQYQNNCNLFLEKLRGIKDKTKKFFIEFPSETHIKKEKILKCVINLKQENFDVSYYISNNDIESCINNLIKNNDACNRLYKTVDFLDKQNIFNNISFDYKFSSILDFYDLKFKNLKLNTWHIKYDEIKNIDFNKYNLIIPYTTNHNRNTY